MNKDSLGVDTGRLYLQHRDDASELPNELDVSVVPSVRARDIPSRIVLIHKVIPADVHTFLSTY